MQGGVAVAHRPVNNRAHVKNSPRRLSVDTDMRSLDGRRFADLYDALAAEFPGVDPVKIREVAILKFAAE